MAITHSLRAQRGFSLSESLISLTVLSSGLLALAQFQGKMHENSSHTKTQTTAVNLAQQKLEQLRDQAVTNYAGIAGNRDTPPTSAGDNSAFNRHWTVTSHRSPDYKEVSVTTAWQSSDGTPRSVSIVSFLAPTAPYTGGLGTESGLEDETPASTESSETTESEARENSLAEQTDSTDAPNEVDQNAQTPRTSTCLCTREGSSDSARLDHRNSNQECMDACCQDTWHKNAERACQGEDCEFVAQCATN